MTKEIKHTQQSLKKIELVLESVSNGVSVAAACESAELARSVFYDWRRASVENHDRYYDELDKCTSAIESALYNKAIGGEVVAMIFWLTNRSKGRWLHKQVQEIQAQVNHSTIMDELEEDDDG